jgi:hypothetical protein
VHRPLPHAPRVLAGNREHYELLLDMVRHHAAQEDVERTLRSAMLAANYAWLAPVGLLSDMRLERLLVHAVRGGGTVTVDGARENGRVLHVLTQAYPIGGHTRQAARWIARDHRSSDVALTNQHAPVPDRLVDAARESGGDLHDLRASEPSLLGRARRLRRLMDQADLVVLTVHPYDAVAFAAVNLPGERPPVIYSNHADLAFWLGVGAADLLCDWRPEAREVSVGLRAVAEDRVGVLPLPVEEVSTPADTTLRASLGIRVDSVVAVTVGDDWKVGSSWGRGMTHVLDRVLRWCPQLDVVLVGISPTEDWDRLARRHPGRLVLTGRVSDPGAHLALADLYLETYPVRAGNTPLEAAAAGLPVVGLADMPDGDPVQLFQAGSPGLADSIVATSVEEFTAAVRRLVADPERRRRAGADVRGAVLATHDGPGWRGQLETLYLRARTMRAVDVDTLRDSSTDDRFGAMLLSATMPVGVSPDPHLYVGPLGELFDLGLQADLMVTGRRASGRGLMVRVPVGWQGATGWTARLLRLASAHSDLAVSLPFVPGDDVRGTRSVAHLIEVLRSLGQTTEDCGDVRLESTPPPRAGEPAVLELSLTAETLDWLAAVLNSPCWDRPEMPLPTGGPALAGAGVG